MTVPTLLFGLGEFSVIDVGPVGDGAVRVVIETRARVAACPECGTMSTRIKDRPLRRVKHLPCSGQRAAGLRRVTAAWLATEPVQPYALANRLQSGVSDGT